MNLFSKILLILFLSTILFGAANNAIAHDYDVYITKYGKYFHYSEDCPNLENAKNIYYISIKKTGKLLECDICSDVNFDEALERYENGEADDIEDALEKIDNGQYED